MLKIFKFYRYFSCVYSSIEKWTLFNYIVQWNLFDISLYNYRSSPIYCTQYKVTVSDLLYTVSDWSIKIIFRIDLNLMAELRR